MYVYIQFAAAVKMGPVIYFSGIVGDGRLKGYDQFKNAFEGLEKTLAEAGCTFDDIIDTTFFIVDMKTNTRALAKAQSEYIKKPYPTSTWIGTTELVVPGGLCEIKVVCRNPEFKVSNM